MKKPLSSKKNTASVKRPLASTSVPTLKKSRSGYFDERKQTKKQKRIDTTSAAAPTETVPSLPHPLPSSLIQPIASKSPASSRLDKYRVKMEGAKFRMLNESLYNGESISTQDFKSYHEGFASQVSRWPTNPMTLITDQLLANTKGKRLIIGDFGCGDAVLAERLHEFHTVHSFDLVAKNDSVTVCDISKHVPLRNGELDVAVFSLSLMGAEVSSFFVEANRVLKLNGVLIVAEVKSRFVPATVLDEDGEEDMSSEGLVGMKKGLKRFQQHLVCLGFSLVESDYASNTMFVLMKFKKTADTFQSEAARSVKIPLRNCPYKRR